jgi:hypothetical protein
VTLPEESSGSGDEGMVEAGNKARAEAPTQSFDVDKLNDATESTEPDEPHEAEPAVAQSSETADEILDRAFGALRGGGFAADDGADEVAASTEVPDEPTTIAPPPAVEATVVDGPRLQPTGPRFEPSSAMTAVTAAWAKVPAQLRSGQDGRKWKIAAAAGTAAVVAIALIIVAVGGSSSHSPASASAAANTSKTTTKAKAAKPKIEVVASYSSMSPNNGANGVDGAGPITVTYSHKLPSDANLPTLSPSIAGSWKIEGNQAVFTPSVGYPEDTHVTVNIPSTTLGTTTTTAATTASFTTGQYSTVRLDQLLAQLGYLPVSWTPDGTNGSIPGGDANAQLQAAYDPPSGSFSFDRGYPSTLSDQWSAGSDNEILVGAVRTFEYDQNITMDGMAGPDVWEHLLAAVAKNETSQHGYTYVYVNQGNGGDEYLDLYHDGRLAISTPANTGIPQSPTQDGTFPVYERFTVTQMQGNNPNGTPYNDTVYWVSYFNGGDAVHAFPRPGYGYYQSLGCVELPYNGNGPGVAENVWNLMYYGNLVTVAGDVA